VKVGSTKGFLAAAGFVQEARAGRGKGFLGEVVGWIDLCRMWLLVDVWGIVFQTDKMENQGVECYLQGREIHARM